MLKLFAVVTLLLAIITSGYGLFIHFGGQETEIAIAGHMVLGILTAISGLIAMVFVFMKKQIK